MPVTLLSDKVPKSLKELEKILLANRGLSDGATFFKPVHPTEGALRE